MSKGRIYRVQMTGAAATKGRIYRAQMTGTAAPVSKGRIYRVQMTGVGSVVLLPLSTPATVEPETLVSLTAVLEDGSTADTYTWRRVSGPTNATIFGSGASVTVLAPSNLVSNVPTAAVVTIGVVAIKGGISSAERTVTFTALPQTDWIRVGSSGWVGSSQIVTV